MGKGAYVGSFSNSFFFFLGVTYSRVLKKQNRSKRLAIAAFLKSAAIGPPKRRRTWEASGFFVVLLIVAFLKNAAISHLFKIYTAWTYGRVFEKCSYRWEASELFWVLPIAAVFEKCGYRSNRINFFKADL